MSKLPPKSTLWIYGNTMSLNLIDTVEVGCNYIWSGLVVEKLRCGTYSNHQFTFVSGD